MKAAGHRLWARRPAHLRQVGGRTRWATAVPHLLRQLDGRPHGQARFVTTDPAPRAPLAPLFGKDAPQAGANLEVVGKLFTLFLVCLIVSYIGANVLRHRGLLKWTGIG
jgi:hypothetical protein